MNNSLYIQYKWLKFQQERRGRGRRRAATSVPSQRTPQRTSRTTRHDTDHILHEVVTGKKEFNEFCFNLQPTISSRVFPRGSVMGSLILTGRRRRWRRRRRGFGRGAFPRCGTGVPYVSPTTAGTQHTLCRTTKRDKNSKGTGHPQNNARKGMLSEFGTWLAGLVG